ncbi:BON domain-containing protein [Agrilutibacter solisilvae]|uniref:BON domain-containing protein n=1 Tax=Agrilutibacter solisilvae TaxID=2763317 RepID=A0A974XZM7_9GAMM|nr:BON domain-containing protein [Lysobacter solisilvae]QSX77885.1 BON domain-containing protein [Lysobacter solisilvae]
MSNLVKLAVAFGAGALVMYLFDPVTGRRRRWLAHEHVLAGDDELDTFAPARSRRPLDRMRDAALEARAQARAELDNDERLEARVRAKIGRLVDRPVDVEVGVEDGFVVLSGHVAVAEIDQLIDEVAALPGVEEVESRLTTRREGVAGEESQRH